MTSGAAVERAIAGRGDDPASTVDPSAAALAANARLEELRRAAGIATRQRLAGDDLDQSAASTSRPQSRPLEDDQGNGGRVEPGHVLKMTGATAAASSRGQAALEARRRELGIKYRRPGAGLDQSADWSAWAAGKSAALVDLDQGRGVDAAASTVGLSPALASLTAAALAVTRARPRRAGDDLDHAASSTSRPLEDDRGGTVAGMVGAQTLDAADQLAGVTATVYPRLAAAFRSSKHVAPVGRLWLLLRAWDTVGRGCHTLDQVYRAFSVEGSAWHVADRRQVQRLIKQGAGTFWTLRDYHGGRYHGLQMTGPVGVALALGVGHLAGSPVAVPVADLLGGMHRVGAALYAAASTLRKGARPVTRKTLETLTGAAVSTQRTYDKTAGVEGRVNFVLLSSGDVDAPGVFIYRGRVEGRPGRAMLARRIANTYVSPLAQAAWGRQRKINRRLDLVANGARGTQKTRASRDRRGYRPEDDFTRIYHDTAAGAWGAWGKAYHDDHYWPIGETRNGAGLWHVVEAVGN